MYIDPNTGGMVFQMLAGLFAAFTGMLLIFSGKIRAAAARLRRWWRERRGGGDGPSRSAGDAA